jgi:hypothetical protein
MRDKHLISIELVVNGEVMISHAYSRNHFDLETIIKGLSIDEERIRKSIEYHDMCEQNPEDCSPVRIYKENGNK